MTLRELRKRLADYNPDAIVTIGEIKDGIRNVDWLEYDLGLFTHFGPAPDPWCAERIVIWIKEVKEKDDSTRTP